MKKEKKRIQRLVYAVSMITLLSACTDSVTSEAIVNEPGAAAEADLPKEMQMNDDLLEGISIGQENRCASYDRGDYRYPQSIELNIIEQQEGNIYNPYTGDYYGDRSETDIEHIVATSEAHDSGLCSRPAERRGYATDLLNLTLADPSTNRHKKSGKDIAEWQPQYNGCWYAGRVVEIKRKWRLSMDEAEARAVRAILVDCEHTRMIFKRP